MGFRAQAVEALHYDFRPLVPDAVGTIPEPSFDARDKFLVRLDEATEGEGGIESKLANLQVEDLRRLESEYREAIAELGQGSPTKEQVEQLPPRHLLSFLGWLVGQLSDPTSSQAATRP